ncbi:hypothetical protein C0J52_15382 [Blattella germanica]|nr:hypothetical protein C0J52_15382 [Blattella germanica]
MNKALTAGEEPPKHDSSTMKTTLSPHVVSKIMPVYQRLASDKILDCCTVGKTQNPNESLHSIAVTSGIAEFNVGTEITQKLKAEVTGVELSASGQKLGAMRDKRRLATNSEVSGHRVFKTARRRLELTKTAAEAKKRAAEGPTYGAGEF